MDNHKSKINFKKAPPGFQTTTFENALSAIANKEKFVVAKLDYEFVSREKIREINNGFLNHDFETDIITFDYVRNKRLAGEVFICLDVVKENSGRFNTNAEEETARVIIHGLLHLMGYKDKTADEINTMREKEDEGLKELERYE